MFWLAVSPTIGNLRLECGRLLLVFKEYRRLARVNGEESDW